MITKTIEELYKIFNNFNTKYFEGKLEEPIILVQSKKKKILGTCSVNRIWENVKSENNKKYEITLTAENLNRSIAQISATLLHEMIHLYCALNNIKDTSNNCVYHNKKFKEEAERRGLIITHAKSIGWSVTTLQPETEEYIKTLNINEVAFEFYRQSFESLKEKAIRYKYQCPNCETKISHYKEINLKCGDCDKSMELRDE